MRLQLLCGIVLMACTFACPVQAGLMIDSFGTTQSLTVTGSASTDSSWAAGNDMLGGYRGIQLDLAAPSKGRDNVDVAVDSSNVLDFSQGSGTGQALLVWDGRHAGEVGGVNPTGLRGVDLTENGQNAALAFDVLFNDLPIDLTFTLYSDSTPYSYTCSLPGGTDSLGTQVIPFAAFPVGFDPARVGAVSLLIDGTSVAGADLAIKDLRCVTLAVPEPSTWLLLSLAGLAVAAYRLKR
jgi:hypothetical protein